LEYAVSLFRKYFWALNDPKSLTIRLGYRSTSPQLAAAVTNAALRGYLAADEQVKAAAIDRSEAWLQTRITQLRTDLDVAEHAVEDFRARHQLATFREQSPLQEQLLQLQGRRVDAEAALAAARAKVVQNHQFEGSDTLPDASDVLASREIQALRTQEASLLAQQAHMSATFGQDYPGVIAGSKQLARLRDAIRTEVNRVAHSNTSDLRLAEMRSAAVAGDIQALQAKIDAQNAYDIKLRSLEADAASKRVVLDSFTQRFDQNAGDPFTPPDSRVVSWASVPVDPVSPKYGLTLVGGTLGFTMLAFCASLARERMRRGFEDMQELEAELGLVAAGFTPRLPRRATRKGKALAPPEAPPLRELALTVRALAHSPDAQGPTRVVLVTSAVAGEGKSTLALSLARSVAKAGQRCLLVDADIRNPSLHATLGLSALPGLVELTLDKADMDTIVRRPADESFDFLSAGRPTQDPLAPFTIGDFGPALKQWKSRFDVVVIDCAPVLLASETLVLAGCVDLILFMVRWRATPRDLAVQATNLLTRCSTGPCLSVMSQVDLRRIRRGGWHTAAYYQKAYHFS
jgi:Mrp family chromosome partitioning ATPase